MLRDTMPTTPAASSNPLMATACFEHKGKEEGGVGSENENLRCAAGCKLLLRLLSQVCVWSPHWIGLTCMRKVLLQVSLIGWVQPQAVVYVLKFFSDEA